MSLRFAGLAALALAIGATAANSQEPPALYGLSHVRNDSNAKATTYYKWGNGPWGKAVIEKGQSLAFNFPYDGKNKVSPDLFIRIDVDTDGVRWVEHVVSRGHAPDDNSIKYGHRFVIKQLKGTDTRYLEGAGGGAVVKVTDAKSTKPDAK